MTTGQYLQKLEAMPTNKQVDRQTNISVLDPTGIYAGQLSNWSHSNQKKNIKLLASIQKLSVQMH